jgi:hypothetical protein
MIDGFCTDCGSWTSTRNGRCGCGSGRVAVPPAGYRILGQDELDPVTLERAAAELARIEPDEDAAGGPANWGDFVQIAEGRIRSLKGGRS